jgi:hypothetical protein
MNNGNVSVPRRGRHVMSFDLLPPIFLYVVEVKVVLSLHSVVASKDVNVVLKPYTRVE